MFAVVESTCDYILAIANLRLVYRSDGKNIRVRLSHFMKAALPHVYGIFSHRRRRTRICTGAVAFKQNGVHVFYGVFPDISDACGNFKGTTFAVQTLLASHELAELVLATHVLARAPLSAWGTARLTPCRNCGVSKGRLASHPTGNDFLIRSVAFQAHALPYVIRSRFRIE
jgi:hypothetical protein